MYKVPLSTFPEVEQIKTEVEPFLKLFQTVLKFQKADKKWLYGNFRELNAEAIEAELDEYTRDVYKVQKYFNNKGAPPSVLLHLMLLLLVLPVSSFVHVLVCTLTRAVKKLLMEIEEKERERKRRRRGSSERRASGDAGAPPAEGAEGAAGAEGGAGAEAPPPPPETPKEEAQASVHVPAAVEVCTKMMDQVGHSKEYLPYISVLCNPGIRQRHWAKMSAIAGFDLTPDSGTTLFKVLNMQLAKFMEEFEQISAAASKEHSLEKALQKMKDEWESIHFNTTVYRDTGVSILSSVDEIQNTLDDQIVKTQTMRGSPFIKVCPSPFIPSLSLHRVVSRHLHLPRHLLHSRHLVRVQYCTCNTTYV